MSINVAFYVTVAAEVTTPDSATRATLVRDHRRPLYGVSSFNRRASRFFRVCVASKAVPSKKSRVVPLPDWLAQVLKDHRRTLVKRQAPGLEEAW